ncbi:MAG TPA: cation-translocating P-type ATPase, partial [Desulfarculaceae bacterium]|nr:cation-translocating P-type ATPase [Desulfarculaceae bacterium]
TDGAPALAFSVDGYGRNIMRRPPKPRDEAILTGRKLALITVLGVAGTLIALAIFRLTGGSSVLESEVTKARTMVFNFVVFYEMILVFIIRREYDVPLFSNAWVWSAVILSIALQGILMYTPMAVYFKLMPLDFIDIVKLLSGGLIFYLIAWLYQSLKVS